MLARLLAFIAAVGLSTLTLYAQAPATAPTTAPDTRDAPMTKGPYSFGPDSLFQADVPHGKMDKWEWNDSKIFPNTKRAVWVYVPAQYDPNTPACLMVFQDGPRQFGLRETDQGIPRHAAEYRTPNVLDNLIHKKELPVIIAVFINPGSTEIAADGRPDFSNRAVEYDTPSDTYGKFLLTEILPEVEKKYNIRKDAAGRGIGGISSGAILAFSAAWFRPDQFSKVHSDVGSFTNIRGGHVYPKLILESEKKPIKVVLQDGTNDNYARNGAVIAQERNWYLQNRLMRDSFKAKGYEFRYILGDGAHDSRHGGAILPDQLRWLWSDQVKK